MYVTLINGQHFGISCIVGSLVESGNFHIDNWITRRDNLKRQFSIQCKEQCELLSLSIQDLNMMKNEFYDAYTELFQNSFNRLRRTIRIKLKAIKYCDKHNIAKTKTKVITEDVKMASQKTVSVRSVTDDFVFQPICQEEVDKESSLFYSSKSSSCNEFNLSDINSDDSYDLDLESLDKQAEKKRRPSIFNRNKSEILSNKQKTNLDEKKEVMR